MQLSCQTQTPLGPHRPQKVRRQRLCPRCTVQPRRGLPVRRRRRLALHGGQTRHERGGQQQRGDALPDGGGEGRTGVVQRAGRAVGGRSTSWTRYGWMDGWMDG